ncbi:MAG: hypothetical protein QOJ23_4852 [Actinomycetota bacterium]|jgi:hypothetical protein|nr:hypothetical protein [Actinomycetota bacterium]MDQ1496902.1 hypothetical protein [Actinomycetota bacterium]
MSNLPSLYRPGWGRAAVSAITFITLAVGVLVGIAVLHAAATESPLALGALPIAAGIAFGALRIRRVGLFTSGQGVVVRGPLKTLVFPWDEIDHVQIEDITRGFLPQRTVVIVTKTGESQQLYLWNARSLLMLGSPGGLDGLAKNVLTALNDHRGSS